MAAKTMFLLQPFELLLEMGMHLGTSGLIYKTAIYFYSGSLHSLLGKSRTLSVYISYIFLLLFHGNSCGRCLIMLISGTHMKTIKGVEGVKELWYFQTQ